VLDRMLNEKLNVFVINIVLLQQFGFDSNI